MPCRHRSCTRTSRDGAHSSTTATPPPGPNATGPGEQLAEATGFDRKTVDRVENGRHSPGLDRVFVLAEELHVEPAELFHQHDTGRPDSIG
ncbi:helix-turn-helix domain-containing protein [Actinosynnema sp. CS-041913]|uniref:helix-turn-helix domain-containing protein n=1 Tax=Actinosynnema sp. CS-041913 TaxID=3239917 RepID=UPI003D94A5B3